MQKRFFILILVLTVIAFSAGLIRHLSRTARTSDKRAKEVTLIVYAPTSFVDSYGPGEILKKNFEAHCACTVIYVDVGSGRLAIDRMAAAPKNRVDVVLGLDLLLLKNAASQVKFQALNELSTKWQKPIRGFSFQRFMPYDWSPMGFVYREPTKDFSTPPSFAAALASWPEKSLSLADPSSSTVGLEWLYWVYRTQSNPTESLQKLSHLTSVVTPTWSAAYGLFKKHQVNSTFTYLTSLLYHWQVEKDESYRFLPFQEGHPIQVEYAAVPESCWNCTTAKNFVEYLVTPEAQKIIAEKNYMLPVIENVSLDPIFENLPTVTPLGLEKIDDFLNQQAQLIEAWRKAN